MDEIIRQRMYNIYQGQIPLINGAQIPIQYEGEIYGSGFVDLPGGRRYIQNDGNIAIDFNDWAEMVARQLAALNTNVIPPQPDEQRKLFEKLQKPKNAGNQELINKLIKSLKQGSGKPRKASRVQHMKNTYIDLHHSLNKMGVHPRKIAEIFFDGFQKSGGSMKDLYRMLNRDPHVYNYYQYY